MDIETNKLKIHSITELKKNVIRKSSQIPSYVKERLPNQALELLFSFNQVEFSADIIISMDDGQYLYSGVEKFADNYILIARSGQGDEWLCSTKDWKVNFYDHNQFEEFKLINLNINLEKFIIMADLIGQFEKMTTDILIKEDFDILYSILGKQMSRIRTNLLTCYPYDLSVLFDS